MPFGSGSSSRHSSRPGSNGSSQRSEKDYALSVNIYGRGDATVGDGPSHMGIAIYEHGSCVCEMHHIRNLTDEDFVYDPRSQPLEDPVLKGRCELASLTKEQKMHAGSLLAEFGNEKSNIPEFGLGNCQDWVAAAVNRLEQAGFLVSGEGEFWKSMINKSSEGMKEECLQTGRTWISGPESTFEGEPDARFIDNNRDLSKPVGKLAQNEAFLLMRSILETEGSEGSTERPFYVSSPFFSRMNDKKD